MHPRSSHGRVRVRIGDNLYKRFTDGGEPRYEVKFRDTDGSLRSVTLKGASTDAGARKAAREVLRARDSGTRQVGKPVTVDETFAAWRADLDAKVGAGQRSARGVEVYVGRYMRHIRPAFGPIRLDKVTKADLLDLVATLRRKRLSEATCLGVLGTVRSLYSFAQRRDLVSRNPVADIHPDDRPRPTKTARPILDEAQVDVLVAHSPELYRAAVATLAWTGMRVSEVVALQWQHVDFVERDPDERDDPRHESPPQPRERGERDDPERHPVDPLHAPEYRHRGGLRGCHPVAEGRLAPAMLHASRGRSSVG